MAVQEAAARGGWVLRGAGHRAADDLVPLLARTTAPAAGFLRDRDRLGEVLLAAH